MSATIRAAAALLDASYQVEDTAKADIWREMAVEARQEYDGLRDERDKALEVIRLILEADCLRPHAFDRGDDDASIYELCRHLGKS
jgi:hypothetical protein